MYRKALLITGDAFDCAGRWRLKLPLPHVGARLRLPAEARLVVQSRRLLDVGEHVNLPPRRGYSSVNAW